MCDSSIFRNDLSACFANKSRKARFDAKRKFAELDLFSVLEYGGGDPVSLWDPVDPSASGGDIARSHLFAAPGTIHFTPPTQKTPLSLMIKRQRRSYPLRYHSCCRGSTTAPRWQGNDANRSGLLPSAGPLQGDPSRPFPLRLAPKRRLSVRFRGATRPYPSVFPYCQCILPASGSLVKSFI